jgi:uncharacterized protein (DUF885 family)
MKKLLPLAAIILALHSCDNKPAHNTAGTATNQSDNFNQYSERFVTALWERFPSFGSAMGYHRCDSVLIAPTEDARKAENDFARAHLDSLKKFDLANLSASAQMDYRMMESYLQSVLWSNDTEKAWQWNPAQYNVCERFAEIANGNYGTLESRLHSIAMRLQQVPAYYEAAKANIKDPTKEHTQLAIDQNIGGVSVFEKDIPEKVKTAQLDTATKAELLARCRVAAESIRDYAAWLKALPNPRPRSFRLGKELYEQKFRHEIQSGYTLDEMYAKAIARKQELHGLMYHTALKLWDKYLPQTKIPEDSLQLIRQVIDKISLNHTRADSFQASIEQQIPELVAFINKKDLITLDPKKPLVVRREPDYMAGVAGASISAPGPYDKGANTYYNVGSLSGWPKDKAESYLREYNHYTLQILNIHEAIPGHYTQLVYANQSPSLIKSIFGNGTMIEGWAVYTERMMLENGYGAVDGATEAAPEMWLMYYKWNLRSTCNFLLDYSVHTGTMSKEEGLDLLTRQAFQQQAEAEGKWKRVSVTQVQLCSYFSGYSEIYALREDLKKKEGNAFNLKKFHEQFLSYGSAPVKYIREMMLSKK